jgi:hypothetical protein
MKNWGDGMLDLWGDVPEDFLRDKNEIFEHVLRGEASPHHSLPACTQGNISLLQFSNST